MVDKKEPNALPEKVKRFIMVELHCDMTQCKPCKFPVCPLLEQKNEEELKTKTVELSHESSTSTETGKKVVSERVRRYLMVELSCDDTSCNPCTYPNCQRFIRDTHLRDGTTSKKPKVRRILSIDKDGKILPLEKKEN